MKRIMINEVDNTANVEQLSSYDVAYVPGFSTVAQDDPLFRIPTLVTSKYQFLQLFGEAVPTFRANQNYPEAKRDASGFPSYAIPNFSNLVVTDEAITLDTFMDLETLTFYYVKVEVEAEQGEEDWIPEPTTQYFLVDGDGVEGYTVQPTTLPLAEGVTYVETYGSSGSDNVYASNVNPDNLNWYELMESGYVPTSDTQIEVANDDDTVIKAYYQAEKATPPMFMAGDADPGYRYALYLLSLGVPVYYEQMNSVNFTEIDLISDFKTNLSRYGTTDEGDTEEAKTYISPYEQGWYYYDGEYKKCNDPTIKYFAYPDTDHQNTSNIEQDNWFYGADISLDSMYTGLEKRFVEEPGPDYSFDSIGDYSIKYVTSGGYPTFEYGKLDENGVVADGLAYAMMNLCNTRGDAIALIDHTDNPERSIYESDELSVIYQVREKMANYSGEVASHGAMFTPWFVCSNSLITGGTNHNYSPFMPGSLAYLTALATQLKNYNNPWLAVSGVTRGKVPYLTSLHTNLPLTNNVADSYQSVPGEDVSDYALVSINPITYIRQYGYCIWGNRTLKNNKTGTQATSFLNIRSVVSDVKKRLYEASQRLLFEQNTVALWISFKNLITPLLERMVSNNILSDYKITKYNIDPETGEAVPAYKILANIRINPINSVEVFDLTVQLENNEIEVREVE